MTVEELKDLPSLPSNLVQDNALLLGEWEIIGNIPIGEKEDYPVFYGNSSSALEPKKLYFQCGKIFRSMEDTKALYSGFKAMGYGFHLDVTLPILRKCIGRGDNAMFWKYCFGADLRNPRHRDKLKAVCAQFGLNAEEICPKEK